MAGRITIVAGDQPVQLVSLDATGAQLAFQDVGLTTPAVMPLMVQRWSGVTVYVADAVSYVITVKDWSGTHTLQTTTTAVRAGQPVTLGPFHFVHSAGIA